LGEERVLILNTRKDEDEERQGGIDSPKKDGRRDTTLSLVGKTMVRLLILPEEETSNEGAAEKRTNRLPGRHKQKRGEATSAYHERNHMGLTDEVHCSRKSVRGRGPAAASPGEQYLETVSGETVFSQLGDREYYG